MKIEIPKLKSRVNVKAGIQCTRMQYTHLKNDILLIASGFHRKDLRFLISGKLKS